MKRFAWLLVLALGCGDDSAPADAGTDSSADASPDSSVDAGIDAAADTRVDAGRFPAVDDLPASEELPDPFETFFDPMRIETAEQWRDVRRPELLELFQHYVYGFLPEAVPVEATVTDEALLFDASVSYTEVSLAYGPSEVTPISLAIFRPVGVTDAPVLLALNKCGNQSLSFEEAVRETTSWIQSDCELTRGFRDSLWPIEAIVARGYALVTFHESDVDPDDVNDREFEDGVHPHFALDDVPEEARWAMISAWAYGLSRAIDYLQTAEVDATRIATVGHSRRGKAALWAAALDERIAMTIPHQSGTAGATLSRSYLGESVFIINAAFPHWFDGVFNTFANRETQLPIDQHLLIGLVAPRAVFVTNGAADDWADPPGALRAVQAAAPIWELLGSPGLVADDEGIPTQEGPLSWFERPGDHSLLASDWELFMDFADLHL